MAWMPYICLAGVAVLSVSANAATISTDGPPYLAKVGQTIDGCSSDSPAEREDGPIEGNWFAFSGDAIAPAQPYAKGGRVLTNRKSDKILLQEVKLAGGRVELAKWSVIDTRNAARTETKIQFRQREYRLIAWGSESFALETVGPKRTREYSDPSATEIPEYAFQPREPDHDYEPGGTAVESAGDFNGDGVLDVLYSYSVKEAEGLVLWLSTPAGAHALFVSPTSYSDC